MQMKLWAVPICALALALSGCSSNEVSPDEYSGFLKDYKVLKKAESPSGAPVLRWIQPGVDANRFTSVYIEPSQFYPQPQPTEKLPANTLRGITQSYDQALKTAFATVLPLADAPGPNVLVVRAAITAVSASNKGLRPYEVIPVALVAAGVSVATGIRDQDTSVATEAAFLDAGNGDVVAEVVRKGAGYELDNSAQVLKPGDFRGVLDAWASDMVKSYQQLKR
jgi:hypothetical protein